MEGVPNHTGAKPHSPPPAYTEVSSEPAASSRTANVNAPFPYTVSPAGPHTHNARFGPTPINTTQLLLPYAYYGPQGTADVRARWRFVGALLCAVGVWFLLGCLVGVEVWGEQQHGLTAMGMWMRIVFTNGAIA